ncbi:retrovirus-related pol polyprotein from transposon TNT 1-94 [Tanacetum coccineum]
MNVNKAKVPVASDNEVKQFYKPLSKPKVGFSKPNFRLKTSPLRRVNNNYSRPKTPQPKRYVGRQNQPHFFPICLGVDLEPDEWIKDSGSSKHMTGNQNLFSTFKAYNGGNVIFGSNLRGNIIGKGQICDNKCRVTFSEHDSEITKDGKVIGRGIRKKGLYVMKLGNKPKDQICLTTIDENSTLWHRRLGHANMRLIQSLASKELVRNLPKLKFDQHFCDACKMGKQAHASHKAKNVVSTTRCLELLHMDLFGPSAVRSYGGNRYTLVIVDDYSSNSDDIQVAGSDTRPPMLDRTDYESWSQRIRLYCRGKENGIYILQSIEHGLFKLGTTKDTLGTTPEGGVLLGPERPLTYDDLNDNHKKQFDVDVRATNIVLQGLPKYIYKLINHNIKAKAIWDNVKMLLAGSELTKEDRESQLYGEFERFKMLPG